MTSITAVAMCVEGVMYVMSVYRVLEIKTSLADWDFYHHLAKIVMTK